jgi:hypothetical protein
MNSIVVGRYRNIDAEDLKGGHWEPYAINWGILDHINGHFVRPNMVAFKYLNFKKNVDPNAHVRVFNSAMKANAFLKKVYQ